MKKGWQGASNPLIIPMEISVENALNIVVYHQIRLDAHKSDAQIIQDMLDDFLPVYTPFVDIIGTYSGDKESQVMLTGFFESEFSNMSFKLAEFNSLILDVYDVNSDDYKYIWGRTRDRFYHGSYEQRLAALLGFSKVLTEKTVPLGTTAVLAYRTEIINKHTTQQNRMDKVGLDSNTINDYRRILIKKLNKNRGGLIYLYGDDDDCQDEVNAFFPLNILGDRSQRGHYQLIIPKADFRRVCIHTPKPGEKYEVYALNADVWLSTADNADNPIPSGYKAVDGASNLIEPALIGDLSKKYIMATNVNIEKSCDLIFNIVKA